MRCKKIKSCGYNIHYARTASVSISLCTLLGATAGSSLAELAADLLLPITNQNYNE